jgi:hypothetical protein
MLTAFVFVITMNIPDFGGDVTATMQAPTYEDCQRFHGVVARTMPDMGVKYTLGECKPKV